MTTITDTSPVTSVPAAQVTSSTSSNTLSSDFDAYLQMLTVQMENQDPLNPADASEFSVQLATFSALEQQVLTNQLLEQMLSSSDQGSDLSMINALGRKALVAADATYSGAPIDLRIPDLPSHDTAELKVLNAFGGTVATMPITSDTRALQWPPEGDTTATEGATYRFVVTTETEGEAPRTTQVLVPVTVSEVTRTDTGFDLFLENGETHRAATIFGYME